MSAASYVVRPATADDLDRASVIVTSDPHSSWTRQSLAAELKTAWSHVDLLCADELILGLLVWWHAAGEIELLEIATHTEHRRQGVAKRLMQHLVSKARALDVPRIMLEVRRGNRAAICLYEKFGFVVVGERPGYYAGGEDAILMDWRLGAKTA